MVQNQGLKGQLCLELSLLGRGSPLDGKLSEFKV